MTQLQQNYHNPVQSSFEYVLYPDLDGEENKQPEIIELKSIIQGLEKKMQKKDQLIKYLQRKCGNQIIKATRKLNDKITKLQLQNARLQKYINTNKNHMNILSRSLQFAFLQAEAQPTQIKINTPRGRRINGQYRQELLKLSTNDLTEIVIAQTQQLRKVEIACQKNSLTAKSKKQDKKIQANGSRRVIVFDSNQNQNKTNIIKNPKQNTLNLNLNLNFTKLSTSATPKKSLIQAQIKKQQQLQQLIKQKLPKNKINAQIQTNTIIYRESIQCQTELNIQDIEMYTKTIKQCKNQIQSLKKQISFLTNDNIALKQQAVYFAQKIQDYCEQFNNDNQFISLDQIKIDEMSRSMKKSCNSQQYDFVLDSYREVLQIFGIATQIYDKDGLSQIAHDKVHQKLVHQICNMKMQITQLLKQYRFLQKQLHQACEASNHLSAHIIYLQAQIKKYQQYSVQLICLNTQLNEQIMHLQHNLLSCKLQIRNRIQLNDQASIDNLIQKQCNMMSPGLQTAFDSNFLPSQSNIQQFQQFFVQC